MQSPSTRCCCDTRASLKEMGPAPETTREPHHARQQHSRLSREDTALPVLLNHQSLDFHPILSPARAASRLCGYKLLPGGFHLGQHRARPALGKPAGTLT